MCRIYIDFDGVLVDTPKYIKQEIKRNGNLESTFANIKWDELLSKCSEICENLSYLKGIFKNNDIKILTHVYSQNEKMEKAKFINDYIGNIDILFVPHNIKKSEYVNPKGNLLIDDYSVNIESWKNNGGIGYLFENKIKLEEILPFYIEEEQV